MGVTCVNEDYKCIKKEKKIIVFNNIYENSTMLLIIASFLEILIPESKNFKLPLAIEIEDSNQEIEVNKNLDVIGTENFNYFIPLNHYYKWSKSYKIAYLIIITIGMLMSSLLGYIFLVKSNFDLLAGMAFLIVFSMSIFIVIRFKKEVNLINKYEKKDIKL